MKVNREELLKGIEAVLPGLSPRELIEQSSCVVFKNKKLVTFNDEISCSYAFDIGIEGVVVALPLVNLLRKLKEDFVEITVEEGKLLVKGKGRRAVMRMDKEILLPIDSVENAGEWVSLPEKFIEGLKLVQSCAGKDDSQFVLTCVHIHPKWIEACDNQQAGRYIIKTGFDSSVLVRRDSLKHIVSFDMTEVSETKNWIHFRNPTGLVLSCRRYVEEYPDLTPIVKVSGTHIQLPKGLIEATERAEVFSSANVSDNNVYIQVDAGKVKIEGEGVFGNYKELKKVKYDGPKLSFHVSPTLLKELVEKHSECQITEKCLKIEIGRFRYISVLSYSEKKE